MGEIQTREGARTQLGLDPHRELPGHYVELPAAEDSAPSPDLLLQNAHPLKLGAQMNEFALFPVTNHQ